MRSVTLNVALQLCFWVLVFGLPAPQDATVITTTIPTSTAAATSIPTTTHTITATPTDIPLNNVSETSTGSTSPTTIIILIIVFVLFPLAGLYFCCRGHMSCIRRKGKRNYYNAAYPQQIQGGVYLVPVNHFVPPDSRTGYTVRVDTPANPTDMATPVYPEIHPPSRAASPPGRENGKNGGWTGLFKA